MIAIHPWHIIVLTYDLLMCRYGIWADTDWHGERLQGLWNHGQPDGPFKARETGMYSSICIREGVIMAHRAS